MVKWIEAVRLTAGREFVEIWYFPKKLEQSVRVRLVEATCCSLTDLDSEALQTSGCSNLPVV
ncbi:hypothetical protein NEUTE1DRAFT_117251 [Neurospora tetrasperma FGSC 2508]|uniref:Uncharacterized protein n=1 Tax=Neurospora tetrasperma (strain FGSC 2508 / ATCC MYA-4615 / P0657) TaxID=510951 RepID=F8MP38_NEUT8|nr:uncharacterized protein NEUTE1DRAFT_117251 [Neurospora tetrasperma FGSC 2508]EGO56257.1 hypothetical protein NEUTE1DRAFT_117251 [Neurospora tetrasperma FGSC 2508]EGZ70891.1 hypothetical protein NEUTE2DRAFT_145224 [Neurospora tetrasperma FGSC 2509]